MAIIIFLGKIINDHEHSGDVQDYVEFYDEMGSIFIEKY